MGVPFEIVNTGLWYREEVNENRVSGNLSGGMGPFIIL